MNRQALYVLMLFLIPVGMVAGELQTVPQGYTLVWNDEFEGDTLNMSDWTYEVKDAGWVNNELQYYVAGKYGGMQTLTVGDGTLKIICSKFRNRVYSSRIYAHVNEGWLYGYFESRIRLPKGKGTWPAFWMMPVGVSNWPDCGEIDIMEEVGYDPNVINSSIHCHDYNHPMNTQKTVKRCFDGAEDDFHVYGCEWTPEWIKFSVDGIAIMVFYNEHRGNDAWPFDKPFFPILNLAWGGDWGGLMGVDETALPATMEVDYVRVYQHPAPETISALAGIWMIGADGSIGQPNYTSGNNWNPEHAIALQPAGSNVWTVDLTTGQQLNAGWVNFKFFPQPDWGKEYCHHDGWGVITSDSQLLMVGTGSDGYDNGNIHLPTGKTLDDNTAYRLSVNTTRGIQDAHLQCQVLPDEPTAIQTTPASSASSSSSSYSIYTLSGQRVKNPSKGIFIVNGKQRVIY